MNLRALQSRRRRSRGQATVETAVLCIVLVPLLLYAFFLDDLLRFKLDLAEAVFSAPWDYTTVNYENPGSFMAGAGSTSVQHNIRLGLCDHTTAYNSYDGSFECKDFHHHVSMSAHECWIVPGAHQVKCSIQDADVGTEQLGQTITTGIKDKVKQGGQISCNAQLAVINYYLPQKVLQDFSKVLTTRTEMQTNQDVHGVAAGMNAQNTYILEQQQFSLVTDTWAMTSVEDVDPDSPSGVLFDRMSAGYPQMFEGIALVTFPIQAMSDQLLSPIAVFADNTPMGDLIFTPQLGFSKSAPPTVNDYYSSAWDDNGNNQVEKSYNDRGNHYMGMKQIPN